MSTRVFQIDVDGEARDVRPTYAAAMARLAKMTASDPRSEATARAIKQVFPGEEVARHCDPKCFLFRAVASSGRGQQRIAVHDLDACVSEKTLVDWIHCLTELDPTFVLLFGLYLVRGGFETKRKATAFVGDEVANAVRSSRRVGVSDSEIVERLREVELRTAGMAFVPDDVGNPESFVGSLAELVKSRFLQIADELGI
jgi:hypothetical protein